MYLRFTNTCTIVDVDKQERNHLYFLRKKMLTSNPGNILELSNGVGVTLPPVDKSHKISQSLIKSRRVSQRLTRSHSVL